MSLDLRASQFNAGDGNVGLGFARSTTQRVHLPCFDPSRIAVPNVPDARKRKVKPPRSPPNSRLHSISGCSRLRTSPDE